MPHKTKVAESSTTQIARAERARKQSAGSKRARDESDDEDKEWEWIYENDEAAVRRDDEDDLDSEGSSDPKARRKSRSTRKARQGPSQKIIGARKGSFECRLGDCLVIGEQRWMGIVSEFLEDGGDMGGMITWFASDSEIKKTKRRSDKLPNEIYITTGMDFDILDAVEGKPSIVSERLFNEKYPNGKIPKKSKDFGNTFICRRGCNLNTFTYTEEFVWEDMYHGAEEDVVALTDFVKQGTLELRKRGPKRTRKEEDFEMEDTDNEEVSTPRKKQKTSTFSTPRKPKTPTKFLTPSHKRVVIKRPLEFTPLGTRTIDPEAVFSSPFQTARSRLHVSAVPASLPCREDEFGSVYSHLEAAITDGSGTCIYISGTPGTGKTATVREVVAQLNASVLEGELGEFIFVEINGMKVTDPHQSYSLLWEALKGDRVSPAHALELLEREFSRPSPRRVPIVVLMDELDQLVTKNQSVMYNFFNWPGLRHSKLIVLAVANTMDLPERTLSNKISSRLGLTRITFPGYTHDQLMKIIQSRLEGVPGNIVESDAVQFASRKVAAVSGDARRALDICRRAVELAEADVLEDATPNTPSKSAVRNVKAPSRSLGKVTIATVKRAINEATTSPLQQHLRGLPLSSKVLLAALLAKTRRTGVAESILGEVLDEAKRMGKMDTGGKIAEFLMKDDHLLVQQRAMQMVAKNILKVPRVLSMGSSALDLMEAGIIGLEARRADRTCKVRLAIGEEDIKLAFKDDPEVKGLGF